METITLAADEIIDMEDYDLYIETINLAVVELEKKRVKNLREKAALTIKIIDKEDTEIFYGYPYRTKYEVRGAFKLVQSRGVALDRIKVYNLYFRFKSSRLDGTSTAMMFREKPNNEEYILLLPDDTEATYENEKRFYLDKAKELVFKFEMESDEQSKLIQNLRLLNIQERCAQSLQHEWGHILHYRCFDTLSDSSKAAQLQWFYDEGYVTLLDERYPGLGYHSMEDLLYYIKEAFAEDLRIGLNFKTNHGMFILPNAVTFLRDFTRPDLLLKGVSLVEDMVKKVNVSESKNSSQSNSSGEIDRISMGKAVAERGIKYPHSSKTITPELINRFVRQFEEEENEKNERLYIYK